MNRVVDFAVRQELLDPNESFLVQAPAGSGKTELLTQRILSLLQRVEKPENILAITFTRKAAAEMKARVLTSLHLATLPMPDAEHEQQRWHLASQVLQRDQQQGWNLMANPSRLNITTIDSLCSSLSGHLPLLSQIGTGAKIAEQAQKYYREAAMNLIASVAEQSEIGAAIRQLLIHKDNQVEKVIELIATLLGKRLQWLSQVKEHAAGNFNLEALSDSLKQITEEKLTQVYRLFGVSRVVELPELLTQASRVLTEKQAKKIYLSELGPIDSIRPPIIDDLAVWKGVAELFLTSSHDGILKRFDVRNGFPPPTAGKNDLEKSQFAENKTKVSLIASEIAEIAGMTDLLGQILLLPDNHQDAVDQALVSLLKLLPLAVAHLKLIFGRYNLVDFPELSLASLDALGNLDNPSDLALALDHRLDHILVDEFQDTSTPQIKLLQLLMAGWQADSGKTLFLVGDPMQSIYRFRDANVSLFIQVREQGIGGFKPRFRQLQVNFRSSETIVNWVNRQFSQIMPVEDDMTYAAIRYSDSVAFNPATDQSLVAPILIVDDEKGGLKQSQLVLDIISTHLEQNKSRDKKQTLAVLAKSRNHLAGIINVLNQNNIIFEAVEIDPLSQKILVQDLVSLTFALLDPFDELSWCACMRSPWFGLSLQDIQTIMMQTDKPQSLLARIEQANDKLSIEGQARCQAIVPLLRTTLDLTGFKNFNDWLLGCFTAVGGLYQLEYASDHDDLQVCVDKLAELYQKAELTDRDSVFQVLDKLYAAPNAEADGQVQIMTIHKSKGLEFDWVILPSLDRSGQNRDQELLKWSEVIDKQGNSHHLLAISKQTGQENSPLYRLLSHLENKKSHYENQRLLYVAATRAKQRLYLLGNVTSDNKSEADSNSPGLKHPNSGSFLGLLWAGILDDCSLQYPGLEQAKDSFRGQHLATEALFQSRLVKRVKAGHWLSRPQPDLADLQDLQELQATRTQQSEQSEPFSLMRKKASAIGDVLHHQLQYLANTMASSCQSPAGYQLPMNWFEITESQLGQVYPFIDPVELKNAAEKVIQALESTLCDPFGQLLLSAKSQSFCELVLHKRLPADSFLTRVIDRTFVADGLRWIVDYKSSEPVQGEAFPDFIQREKAQYQQQLQDYFTMMMSLEKRPTKAGLYFPMLKHFELMFESD